MPLPTTNISIQLVRRALRYDSASGIVELCRSDFINKWSKRKPVRSDKMGALTTAEMAACDFGFNLRANGLMTSSVYSEIFANRDWEYLNPRGDAVIPNEWHRITDFTEYNHDAVSPFSFDIIAVNASENSNGSIVVNVGESTDANCEIHIADIPMFATTGVWGVLYREQGSSAEPIYVGWQMDDPEPKTNPITGPASFNISVPEGTYEVCVVIFKTNDGLYLVPNSFRTVNIVEISNSVALKLQATFAGWLVTGLGKNRVYAGFDFNNYGIAVRSVVYNVTIYAHNSAGVNIGAILITSSTIEVPIGLLHLPIGEIEDGPEKYTKDESGDGVSYSYYVSVVADDMEGYKIERTGEIDIV
jgi:hypothetical protein